MNFNIVINTDDNYIQHAMAMLCSLYENNREHEITLHVLHRNLSEKSCNYINRLSARYDNYVRFYVVNEEPLQGVQFRKNRPLSMAAYYRLLLSTILPKELDKVLYLDCDIIVVRDIREIFEIEIDKFALAASLDRFPYSQQHRQQLHMEVGERTFCSGIMLVNLKYWREHNVELGLLEYAKRYRKEVYLHDQDVLNYYFKKQWFLLPPKWNRVATSVAPLNYIHYHDFDKEDYVLSPMLYHYASVGIKPWMDAVSPEKSYYIRYLRMSGFQECSFISLPLRKRLNLFYITMKYIIKYNLYRYYYKHHK